MRLWNLAGHKGNDVESVIDWTADGQRVKDAFKAACREGKSEFDRLTVINSTQGRVKTRRFKTPTEEQPAPQPAPEDATATEAEAEPAPKKRGRPKKSES